MRGWNSHPLRSERNWTPEQLWANGMMDLRNSYVTHVAEVQESISSETLEELEWFGMDWYFYGLVFPISKKNTKFTEE